MQIITTIEEYRADHPTAVAIGKFDGVHRGHRALLARILAQKEKGLAPCVLTFVPSPEVYFGGRDQKELTTGEEKREVFEQMGIELLVEFPFNQETAAMPAQTFIRKILAERLHAGFVAAGPDLSFGDRGAGNFGMLSDLSGEYGYTAEMIPKVEYKGQVVSSTMIRGLVLQGKMEEAAACLGSPYCVRGIIRHGNAIGRTMDIPTLNLVPERSKLLPPFGVYYSTVSLEGKTYPGMTNIGIKPTIHETEKHVTVETYLYGFSGDIYGENASVYLQTFRRPERKFKDLEALKAQMNRDLQAGRAFHGLGEDK